MPIDPNIPLGVDANIPLQAGKPSGPFGPDLKSLLTMQELAQRMSVVKQAQQDENALRNVFSQAGNLDEKTGYLSPQGLKMLGEQSPTHYMDYLQKASVGQERQLRATAMEGELYDRFKDHGRQGAKKALKLYDENLIYGPEVANEAMRKAIYENWEEAGKMGFPPKWRSPQPLYTDVTALRAGIAADDASRAKPPTPITPYQQAELGIRAKEVERGATTTPTNVEIVQPDGTKEQGTAVYNKDLRTWQRPDGSAIVGTVTEVAKPKVSGTESTKLHGKAGTYNVQTPDGKTEQMFLQPNQAGDYIKQDKTPLGPEYKILGEVPPTQVTSPDALAAQIDEITQYKIPLPAGFARLNPAGWKIIRDEHPEYNAQNYAAAQKLRAGYASTAPNSPGGNMNSINTAVQHLEVFDDLAKALKNPSDAPAVNAVVNYVRYSMGRPEVTNFDTASQVIADEVVKSVTGAGGVYDRENMQKALRSRTPEKALHEQAETIRRLMAGRLNSLEKQWTSIPGMPAEEFEAKVLPGTLEALEKLIPARERASAQGRKETPVEKRQDAGGYKVGDVVPSPGGKGSLRFLGVRPGQDPSDKNAWEVVK